MVLFMRTSTNIIIILPWLLQSVGCQIWRYVTNSKKCLLMIFCRFLLTHIRTIYTQVNWRERERFNLFHVCLFVCIICLSFFLPLWLPVFNFVSMFNRRRVKKTLARINVWKFRLNFAKKGLKPRVQDQRTSRYFEVPDLTYHLQFIIPQVFY